MIKFYTTSCPKCEVLKSKLDAKGIQYETIKGAKSIQELGYMSAPLLEVDDNVLEFGEAVEWVNKQ